jgi:hypothetical protein
MSRFSNRPSSNPLPRIKVKVIETGRNVLGSYSIYQDDRGRQATLTAGMEDENDTILVRDFESGLKERIVNFLKSAN